MKWTVGKLKKKLFSCFIGVMAVLVLASSMLFIQGYQEFPLICDLKVNELTLSYEQAIDNQLSTYFDNYDGNRTFNVDHLVFEEARDYDVKIRCGLFQSTVLFHIIDEVNPVIRVLDHYVDIASDQDFSRVYEVEEFSDYEVQESLDFNELSVGLENLCITVRDAYGNEASECTYLNVIDSSQGDHLSVTDLQETIDAYLDSMNIRQDEIAISYQNLVTGETFFMNEDQYMFAASLYKLPLAMLYFDELKAGTFTLDQELQFLEEDLELGGPVAYTYLINSWIPIEELLYDAIVYSDNSAARMLYRGVGGWEAFKTKIKDYSDQEYERRFYNNEFTTAYINDVLRVLYENAEHYESLLEWMNLVFPDDYLNRYVDTLIVQKYGNYDTVQNIAGIVFAREPYAVSIMSDVYQDGIDVIGHINEILYAYNMQ